MSNIVWTAVGLDKIKNTKKEVLRKKLIVDFVASNYTFHDKLYKYLHMLLAISVPIVSYINDYVTEHSDSNSPSSAPAIVLGGAAFIMIKIRDYLKYDRIREVAKQQSVKYVDLYKRIEREVLSPNVRHQSEDDFIYWINREFNSIEMSDPDISLRMKNKFETLCKHRGFNLLDTKVDVVIDQTNPSSNLFDIEMKKVDASIAEEMSHGANPFSNVDSIQISQIVKANNVETRPRAKSDEYNKDEFKKKIDKLDSYADMQWAMDRLNDLNDS
jgi:hypothetical protein